MKAWAVIEIEPFESPSYWSYWDSREKAEIAKKFAEDDNDWTEEKAFHFIIREIDIL